MSTSRSRVPVAPGMPGWFDPAAGWTPPGNTQRPATPPPAGSVEHGLRQIPAIVEIDRVTGELVRISAEGRELPVLTYRSRPDGGNRFSGITLRAEQDLLNPANWIDSGPYMTRPTALGSWSHLSIIETARCPSITAPIARYYMYVGTDHETRGGVRMMYADKITGPWTLYTGGLATGNNTIIYEDLDDTASRAPAYSTETPDVIWDPAIGKLRMFYHCVNPCYGAGTGDLNNPSDAGSTGVGTGARSGCTAYAVTQGTMSATSDDGLRWTKDRNFAFDLPSTSDAYAMDHTGYLTVSRYRSRYVGYHSLGGTLAGGQGRSFAANLGEWTVDAKLLRRYTPELHALGLPDYEMVNQWDMDYIGGRVIETTGNPVLICKARFHKRNVAGTVGPKKLVAAPLTPDLSALAGDIVVIGQGDQYWHTEGLDPAFHGLGTYGNSVAILEDSEGLAIVYLTANYLGVMRYVGK